MTVALPTYGYVLGFAHDFLIKSTPDMPHEVWWVAGLILLVLGAAAAVDAWTSTVPDPLIFLGLLSLTGMQGEYVSWPFASEHLAWALGAALTLWAINQAWYRIFKYDAIGMGDAKWTMLAAACFDLRPVIYAWGTGAVVAVLWMGVLRLFRFQIARVYFAPFLFIGLVASLYWLRVR